MQREFTYDTSLFELSEYCKHDPKFQKAKEFFKRPSYYEIAAERAKKMKEKTEQ